MDNAQDIFHHLKAILAPYSDEMHVVADESEHFYLDTRHIMKNKQPMHFGSVKINKNYVSFHLMPVYVFPESLATVSPELKRRMQGKSCFNFKKTDPQLFQELRELTQAGYDNYRNAGYL